MPGQSQHAIEFSSPRPGLRPGAISRGQTAWRVVGRVAAMIHFFQEDAVMRALKDAALISRKGRSLWGLSGKQNHPFSANETQNAG